MGGDLDLNHLFVDEREAFQYILVFLRIYRHTLLNIGPFNRLVSTFRLDDEVSFQRTYHIRVSFLYEPLQTSSDPVTPSLVFGRVEGQRIVAQSKLTSLVSPYATTWVGTATPTSPNTAAHSH